MAGQGGASGANLRSSSINPAPLVWRPLRDVQGQSLCFGGRGGGSLGGVKKISTRVIRSDLENRMSIWSGCVRWPHTTLHENTPPSPPPPVRRGGGRLSGTLAAGQIMNVNALLKTGANAKLSGGSFITAAPLHHAPRLQPVSRSTPACTQPHYP